MPSIIMFSGAGILLGFVIGYMIRFIYGKSKLNTAEKMASKIIEDAKNYSESKKKELALEMKEESYKLRQDFERETRERKEELKNVERRLIQKEENLDKKMGFLDKKEVEVESKEKAAVAKEVFLQQENEKINARKEEQKKIMERVANMSAEEAKRILMKTIEEDAKHGAMAALKKIEQELQETADKKAREVIALAIQRTAGEHTADITVTSVSIPSDEMKGRIIGREGRNIRAFEVATGVDLIVDDTPEAITISAFDGIRREIARVSLERLIADGRIHPARIEEIVARVTKEMDTYLKEVGEQTALDVGVSGLPLEIIKMLGRLKYRTSYGQNVLQHSLEVARLSKVMASELGLDVDLCLRAGLLHDIGKAVDHDVEGTHAQIGGDILKKYNYPPKLINAVLSHHEGEVKPASPEAVVIAASDAISASRPGARKESLEYYLKRMQKLEDVAKSFKGVEKCFAIQAGREIRVIVQPDEIDDVGARALATEIAKKIESELEYPGQIRVTVVREIRATEVAK